jgi:addiction module HigA family antidote
MRRKKMPPIHPGEFIAEILDEYALSRDAFARMIDVAASDLSDVVEGRRPVTAELALRLGRAFRQTPEFWLNLQNFFDLETARDSIGARVSHIAPLWCEGHDEIAAKLRRANASIARGEARPLETLPALLRVARSKAAR